MGFTMNNALTGNNMRRGGNVITLNTNAPVFNRFGTYTSQTYTAISGDGKYILTSTLISSNGGSSFLLHGYSFSGPCAMSSSGQYMIGCVYGGLMFRSSNYGASFTQVASITTAKNWVSASISSNGQYCVIVVNADSVIYVSNNFNQASPTFTQLSLYTSQNGSYNTCPISSSGQFIVTGSSGNAQPIAISSDYGVSFTKLTNSSIGLGTATTFIGACMSADASVVYICMYNSGLYKSTNLWSGSPTFSKLTSGTFTEQSWRACVTSSDGTYVIASTNAKTYYSLDSGATWTLVSPSLIMRTMSLSSMAHKCVACDSTNYYLYFSNT
jgi:hypothetical protein